MPPFASDTATAMREGLTLGTFQRAAGLLCALSTLKKPKVGFRGIDNRDWSALITWIRDRLGLTIHQIQNPIYKAKAKAAALAGGALWCVHACVHPTPIVCPCLWCPGFAALCLVASKSCSQHHHTRADGTLKRREDCLPLDPACIVVPKIRCVVVS